MGPVVGVAVGGGFVGLSVGTGTMVGDIVGVMVGFEVVGSEVGSGEELPAGTMQASLRVDKKLFTEFAPKYRSFPPLYGYMM